MLKLRDIEPVAIGNARLVHAHPLQPDLLIKTLRTDAGSQRNARATWYRRLRRTGPYYLYVREFREYLAARHRAPHGIVPLQRIVGIVDTDLGIGQVVEKMCAPDGSLAPTLAAWVERDGCTPRVEQAMDDLLHRLLQHNVILGDFHPWNLVYGSDSNGGPRLVMIDGFGEKNIIPHCSMSVRHNRARTRYKYGKALARVRAMDAQSASEHA